ncbi:MAG TPA: hypothetical protein VLG48_03360 [Candidatus Methylomirabilis sp.]|nr:hypothetical protein [Candidatus Methylomirabilis sp.]
MPTVIRVHCGVVAVVSLVLAACTPGHYVPLSSTTVPPPASFAHRAASADVELLWNCNQPQPQTARVSGAARNIGQREVRSIELTVKSVQTGPAPLVQTEVGLPDTMLYGHDPSPFQIDLPLEKTPSRIDLTARFQVTPGPIAPGAAGTPVSLAVEDACAPGRHQNTVPRQ